jgi:hypothetical protein
VHDFLIKELGRAVPYGVYDLAANGRWVSVGVDTAAFCGQQHPPVVAQPPPGCYPNTTRMPITADGGGSNGSRVRLWRRELQKLANELTRPRHRGQPPASRHQQVDQIEHRLLSFISQNWRAQPPGR